MKNKFFIILILIGLLTVTCSLTLYAFRLTRTITPVQSLEDTDLTSSLYAKIGNLDPATKHIVYVAYIAGFFDAVQLEEISEPAVKEFLQTCDGMTLGELSIKISRFYEENPQWRDKKPSDILINVIPRMKKGLPPVATEEKAE